MYYLSDSDSVDSDEGIRYKTDSIRNKKKKYEASEADRTRSSHRTSSSHPHNTSRYHNRSRRYSSSDSDSSKRKRYSSKKPREWSLGKDNPENKNIVDKRQKEDTHKDKGRNVDDGKEKIDKRKETNKHSSSKPDRQSDLKKIVHGPALPGKSDKQLKIAEPITGNDLELKSNYLGPELPPYLKKKTIDYESNTSVNQLNSSISNDEDNSIPTDNVLNVIGPTLPQHSQKMNKEQTTNGVAKKVLGPALPPHFKVTEKAAEAESHVISLSSNENEVENLNKCIGPTLPDHLKQKLAEEADNTNNDLEEETYGPVPMGSHLSQAQLELEERALQMKINQLGPDEKQEPVREEWMVELPAVKASNLGLGPRQFRAKPGPDLSDRSSWTDTPEDKVRKKERGKEEPKIDLQKEAQLREIRKRDKEQELIVKRNKRHKESLVDIHMKKMKDNKDSSASNERRPFSREVDLQVNKFDEAQKKAVLKKAQLLDTRFSTGESKFL